MLQIIQFTPHETVKKDKFEDFIKNKFSPSLKALPGVVQVWTYKLDEGEYEKQWIYCITAVWDNKKMYESRDLNKKYWTLYKLLFESAKDVREYIYNEM